MDGKAIKVEQANNPSFASGGRQRLPLPSTNRDRRRILRSGRRGSGEKRGSPSRGGHLGNVSKYKHETIGLKKSNFERMEVSETVCISFISTINYRIH